MIISPKTPPKQRTFNTEPTTRKYAQPDLTDATLAGLLRLWATALANGWDSLAELTRCQIEKIARGNND
jgi:hypothetical protein